MISESSAIAAAGAWVAGVATGSIATGIATIAIAGVGFSMLAGRIDVRRGAAVILGCFIVFAAPALAGACVQWAAGGEDERLAAAAAPMAPTPAPPQQPPRDPYAGASLIR